MLGMCIARRGLSQSRNSVNIGGEWGGVGWVDSTPKKYPETAGPSTHIGVIDFVWQWLCPMLNE